MIRIRLVVSILAELEKPVSEYDLSNVKAFIALTMSGVQERAAKVTMGASLK